MSFAAKYFLLLAVVAKSFTIDFPYKTDVLCVGCSGGTGVRAVRGLLANGLPPSSLRFVTRDPTRPAAQTLAGLGLMPVVADLDDAASLTKLAAGKYDACYVHGTSGDEKKIDEREVLRAAALAAAFAATPKPPLVVYNSASAPDHTGIPRIEQKHAVEEVLREALPRVAVLRAHLFMEELWKTHTRPGITKRTYAFSVRRDKPLCLTSVKDMGSVAARCAVEGFSSDAPLDVVSDVLTPAEIAAAFGAAQGEAVRHRQAWLLYILSRALLPELHQIIRFYRTTDFGGNAARRNDLLEAFETPPKLQPFAAFLEETRWADAERTYKDLAAPE